MCKITAALALIGIIVTMWGVTQHDKQSWGIGLGFGLLIAAAITGSASDCTWLRAPDM